MEDIRAKASSGRVRSLDGLRGLAAVVVVIHHALLTVPVLAMAYYSTSRVVSPGDPLWALIYTPLHLGWAGTEAVYVFFILSGLVLTLPVLRARPFSWVNYYPRRLVRLYVPVAAAVALAVFTIWLIPRVSDTAFGPWIGARPTVYTPNGVAKDLILVGGVSRTVSPLWSLRWEVLFSLALPLYMYFAVKLHAHLALKFVSVFGAISLGAMISNPYLTYLPMFALGVLIAVDWDRFAESADRINRICVSKDRKRIRQNVIWTALFTFAILCLSSFWILEGFNAPGILRNLSLPIVVAGAGVALYCAAFCQPVAKFLCFMPFQWLGRVSFSLYLIHEPIVIGARFLLPDAAVWVSIVLSIVVSLFFAELFFRLVETPSHRLARALGSAVSKRVEKSDTCVDV